MFSEKCIKSQPAKMVVKAAPRYELLAALETNKRSFPSVAPCVLFQMAESLELVILERQKMQRDITIRSHLLFLKVAAQC